MSVKIAPALGQLHRQLQHWQISKVEAQQQVQIARCRFAVLAFDMRDLEIKGTVVVPRLHFHQYGSIGAPESTRCVDDEGLIPEQGTRQWRWLARGEDSGKIERLRQIPYVQEPYALGHR